LSSGSHHVCLVQDDQLEASLVGKDHSSGRKVLDLFSNDVDASFVRGVELETVVAHARRRLVDLAGDGEDGRGLACAGRAVKEEVREAIERDELVNRRDDVAVRNDVVQRSGSILT
jgi:hypothetical protein